MTEKLEKICKYTIIYVANYKEEFISNLKLQKLLYFIQVYHLITIGKPCFEEKTEAWNFGPVVPEAYEEYKIFGASPIFLIKEDYNALPKLPKTVAKSIEKVVDLFIDWSPSELTKLSMSQDPWLEAYTPCHKNEITQQAIFNYFIERGDED